jgi:hypothetical protein
VSSFTGRAYVYLGSATGLAASPATTLTGPDGTSGYFGFSVAGAGDVNGDGYGDLAVGARGASSNTGRVYVYLGAAAGLAAGAPITLTGPDGASGWFGFSVASAGDVNADGYADLAVGAPVLSSSTGRAYVYLGSASGTVVGPATTLIGPDGANGEYGFCVASAGDVNGDGYADVVVGAHLVSSSTGRAYAYLGSTTGIPTSPVATLTGPDASAQFGYSVTSVGDVSGDGYADVAIGAPYFSSSTGRAHVYFGSGSATSLGPSPGATFTGPDGPNGDFGGSVY